MDQAENLAGTRQAYYPTTVWSEVGRAGRANSSEQIQALENLLRKYYQPLKAHLEFKFLLDEPGAADLLHEFISSKLLLGELINRASRERGRFRSFLLSALDNFAISWSRRENAQRRRPAGGFVSWETLVENGGDNNLTAPGEPFVTEWARSVIADALQRMEAECHAKGCVNRWKVFQARVLAPNLDGREKEPYEKLVSRLGFNSAAKAQNALVTAQRQFGRLLREVVSEYAGPGADADEELRDLLCSLAR